uniref:Glutaredoxin-3 n=1 Tax=Ciona intestinalis TaxID=7719 RepID=F6XTQ1_CIOIN|nr:glutaredoxin-3 [Ciona intestinalis]|eukprot:XP_002127851.1 glutaredoxin-3 [Ciona intestinalis]
MGRLIHIKNEAVFSTRLEEAKKSLVVVHFWAPWAEQCKQMNDVMEELAKKNTNVVFLTIEAEELPEVSVKYEIEAVPTFIFIKNKQKIGKLNGAHAPELTKLVAQHIDTIAPPTPTTTDPKTALNNKLKSLINSAPCIMFMKGNPKEPKCGFSRTMVSILNEHKCKYSTFDILQDQEVRQGLKEFSNWPTYPQLYVNGELIGGLDIVKEMVQEGELTSALPTQDETQTLEQQIKKIITQSHVVLFMKGEPGAPKCGFSRQIVQILSEAGVTYTHFDILTNEDIRQGLKKYSDWPTYPQLYAGAELIGGLDIVKEMAQAGELAEALTEGSA